MLRGQGIPTAAFPTDPAPCWNIPDAEWKWNRGRRLGDREMEGTLKSQTWHPAQSFSSGFFLLQTLTKYVQVLGFHKTPHLHVAETVTPSACFWRIIYFLCLGFFFFFWGRLTLGFWPSGDKKQTNKQSRLEPGRMSLFIFYLTQPKEFFSNKPLAPWAPNAKIRNNRGSVIPHNCFCFWRCHKILKSFLGICHWRKALPRSKMIPLWFPSVRWVISHSSSFLNSSLMP